MKYLIPTLLAIALAVTGAVALGGNQTARAADPDVYTTPGELHVNGRYWRTQCEPYSQTARCRTEIAIGDKWVFNNLTYLPSDRALWKNNPLGGYGKVGARVSWTASNGTKWRSECDTAASGRNGCRSYIWTNNQWRFNNIVHFGKTPSLHGLYFYYSPYSFAPASNITAICSWSWDLTAPQICRTPSGTVIPDPRTTITCPKPTGGGGGVGGTGGQIPMCTDANGNKVPWPYVYGMGPQLPCTGEKVGWDQTGWTTCQKGRAVQMVRQGDIYVQGRVLLPNLNRTPILLNGKTIPITQCGNVVRAVQQNGGWVPIVNPNC